MTKLWAYVRDNTTTYEYGETEEEARAKFREPFDSAIDRYETSIGTLERSVCENAFKSLEYLKDCKIEFIGEVCTNPDCEICLTESEED